MRIGRRAYDLMYRYWAPWDQVGVRSELIEVLGRGEIGPRTHPRVIDLGCGTGANLVHLASLGFEGVGIEFSRVALEAARKRAGQAGVADALRFVEGDLTDPSLLAGEDGRFDLLLDASTLDDLDPAGRRAMAATIARLARPGATLLCWCFRGDRDEMPFISFTGPSRLAAGLAPGEEEDLFGRDFEVVDVVPTGRFEAFLELRRRGTAPGGDAAHGDRISTSKGAGDA
jgi:SAM-dependent methyltransferase